MWEKNEAEMSIHKRDFKKDKLKRKFVIYAILQDFLKLCLFFIIKYYATTTINVLFKIKKII